MAVQPGSARWQELVQQGIIRDGGRNWYLGDAALEIAPMGENGAHNGSQDNLRQYADEIGVNYDSLRTYRDVAAAWPPPNRVGGTPWKVHEQLKSRKELIRSGMTVTQAAAALGQKNTGRTGPQAGVSDRAAAVRDYLADPEVADEVFSDPVTSQQARDIIDRRSEPVARGMGDGNRREEQARAEYGGLAYVQAAQHLMIAKGEILKAVTVLRHVPDEDEGLAVVSGAHEDVKEAGRLLDARLSSDSGTDWDAELERLS